MEDAGAKIDIVFYLEEVDALTLCYLSPGRHVNLHDADRTFSGNSKRVPPAFHDQDACDQLWIQIVFSGTRHDGFRQALTVFFTDVMALQKSVYRTNFCSNRQSLLVKGRPKHRLFGQIS